MTDRARKTVRSDGFDLVITRARVCTLDTRLRNIGIHEGRITALVDEDEDLGAATKVVQADGRWVIPGAIDTHAHIGEVAPEFANLEGFNRDGSFAYETRGAVAGGITTALNYAKFGQGPLLEAFRDSVEGAERESRINILFHGYVMNEQHLAEVPDAAAAGIRSFKVFMPYRGSEALALGGISSLDHAQMSRAFEAIALQGGQALVHAEDGDTVEYCTQKEVAQGMPTLASYERGRPVQAEGDASWTALYLAERAGCAVTIVHVSSPEAIRARRASGYPRAALESCAHYSVLSTESPIGALGKVAPPLRSPEVAQAVSSAVLAGDIGFFGSDHNVWPAASKTDLVNGRAGLPGIGLMLPLVLTHFVYERGMSMERAIELTSTNAARRFGLPRKGWLGVGADADVVVLDSGRKVVHAAEMFSAVDFSPYEGYTLQSWPYATVCAGRLVYLGGEMVGDDHRGTVLNKDAGTRTT